MLQGQIEVSIYKQSVAVRRHLLEMEATVLNVILCCFLVKVCTSTFTQEALVDHLAIEDCRNHEEHPLAKFTAINPHVRCASVTDDKPSEFIYFDNERLDFFFDTTLYTVFQGHLNFTDGTPRYCSSTHNNYFKSFDIHFKSSANEISRVEATPCRAGGYWTNGKVFCSPPECSKFLNQPKDDRYFEEILIVAVNMHDLRSLPDGTSIIRFMGTSDHRLVYNKIKNTTDYLLTEEFLALCEKYGPCYKGKFLNNDTILYMHGGRPPLTMKKMGDKVIIGLRHDPREFIYPEKDLKTRCSYKKDIESEECDSPTGKHTWKILWNATLPYKGGESEWGGFIFNTKWSLHNCKIFINYLSSKEENIVNYEGPCGRYADMKIGNFPYPKIGVFGRRKDEGNFKMRFGQTLINVIGKKDL